VRKTTLYSAISSLLDGRNVHLVVDHHQEKKRNTPEVVKHG